MSEMMHAKKPLPGVWCSNMNATTSSRQTVHNADGCKATPSPHLQEGARHGVQVLHLTAHALRAMRLILQKHPRVFYRPKNLEH